MHSFTVIIESHTTAIFELVTAHCRPDGVCPVGGPHGIRLSPPEDMERLRDSCFIGKEIADLFGTVTDGHDAVKERLRAAASGWIPPGCIGGTYIFAAE